VNEFSPDKVKRLLELLNQEIELFGRICETTEKQAELLLADDLDAFDSSLDSRQVLIEKINGLHQESDILVQSYVSYAVFAAGEKIGEIENAVAKRRDLIAECVAQNDKNTIAAKEKAEDFVERIGQLSLRRKSLELYTQDLPNNPEMFDKVT